MRIPRIEADTKSIDAYLYVFQLLQTFTAIFLDCAMHQLVSRNKLQEAADQLNINRSAEKSQIVLSQCS